MRYGVHENWKGYVKLSEEYIKEVEGILEDGGLFGYAISQIRQKMDGNAPNSQQVTWICKASPKIGQHNNARTRWYLKKYEKGENV